MGIPKAFRWLSERYPLISQLIEENRIPEFDNLYLDMNGIIHNCSHNNNEDVTFRISDEQIFLQTFAYIEHLFSKIKPKKLFFMAIDGVAPRAKMNQQRSRRFKAAKEANDRILEAKRKGEDLPEDDGEAFQSNMITPGTPFMARLTASLKYFINKKISEDANWRGVQVVLSGHEVPGEGEHKIMEYIRLAKAQPEYDPNTRHCLYGLDADLIMLGLLSHDPHFCLLREEVLFGPAKLRAAKKGLESTNFYLMHLSLLREYLDIEFAELHRTMTAENPYDLERIIDDFILLAFFIGNDFLPHLPDLHIHEGALNLLFGIYKRVLPTAGGYLNEHGMLNKQRLQLVLNELATFEKEKFEEENADGSWIRLKNAGKEAQKHSSKQAKGKLTITKAQRSIVAAIKTFVFSNIESPSLSAKLEIPSTFNAADRTFLQSLGDDLKLDVSFDEFDENDDPVIVVRLSEEVVDMLQSVSNTDEEDEVALAGVDHDDELLDGEPGEAGDDGEWEDVDEEQAGSDESLRVNDAIPPNSKGMNDTVSSVKKMSLNRRAPSATSEEADEWRDAIERVFTKYEKAPNAREAAKSLAEHEQEYSQFVDAKLQESKTQYYKEKLEFDITKDPQALKDMAHSYIEGLQWVLHYYYDGVASWSWYYPYHYSPKISDLVNVPDMTFDFDLNKPFKPFQQLMGVLPALSKNLVPIPFRDLMTDPNSPIKDFYPESFEQDLNGKKQEWEAIVKIPFLQADRLVAAMAPREVQLTEEERQRNSFGESYSFTFDPTFLNTYPSSMPGFFPDLYNCRCRMDVFHLPTLGGLRLVKGLCEGVLLHENALPGFPSLYTLPHTPHLAYHSVNVFQADSRNESIVLSIENRYDGQSVEQVAHTCLGQITHAGWPFLQEAKVVGVADEEMKYTLNEASGAMVPSQQMPDQREKWRKSASKLEHVYTKRFATLIHEVDIILSVRLLRGLKRLDDGALVKDWDEQITEQAVQATVLKTARDDPRYIEKPPMPVEQEFPEGTKVFFLGEGFYGTPAIVMGHVNDTITIQVAYFPNDRHEPHIFAAKTATQAQTRFFPSHMVAKQVRMSSLTLSKITSSLMMDVAGGSRFNAGLNLKFEARSQKVLGYAQRSEQGWEFSQKAIDLVNEYKQKFPEVISALDSRKADLTKASDFFPQNTESRVEQLKAWIKEKGVRDFEKVSLYSDQMEREGVQAIEVLQNQIYASKDISTLKSAVLKNLPRRTLLKPEHAGSRLQDQRFSVGDRIITVQETGSVPLAVRGVVVGIQAGFIDCLFDIAFMGGTTLGGRCSPYRGMSVLASQILNLSDMQYVQSTKPKPASPKKSHAGLAATNGHHHAGMQNGHKPSATAHPSYRGISHRGGGGGGGSGVGATSLRGARGGGPTQILVRNGKVPTGNYLAATQGSQDAYSGVSQSASLLSSLTGQAAHAYNTGPGKVQKQDYHNVAPPPLLDQPSRHAGRGGNPHHHHHHHPGGSARGRGLGYNGPAPTNRGRGRGGLHQPGTGSDHTVGIIHSVTNGNGQEGNGGHTGPHSQRRPRGRGAHRGGDRGRGKPVAAQ